MPRCKTILFTLTILAVLGGAFIINPSTAKALTAEELRAQIDALIRQLNALQAQLAEMQPPTEVWCHDFNVNLRIGDRGEEILSLKTALIKDGVWPYMAVGNEFDEETASYVVGFQEKYASEVLAPWGLAHGTGFVGATTRAKLNTLYGCEAVTWKTYKDEKFAFRTSYPSNVTPRVSYSSVTWDLERDGRISFWAEKDSSETQSMSFKDFAIHLARNLCAADGPMGSIYCTDPIDLAEFTNQQDIWGYKFYITQIEQSNCNKVTGGCDEEISKKGPIVVFRYPEGSAYRGAYLEVFENIPAKAYTTHVFNQMLSTFKFIEAETPPITVLSPNGGEEWVIGNKYIIRWTSETESSRVVIDLLDAQGKVASTGLPAVVANNEAIEWTIPTGLASGQYKIRVMICPVFMSSQECANVDLKQYGFDESDNYFSIVAAPSGGVTCTDTDNGKDYGTKGTTRWGPINGQYYTSTDRCSADGKTLSEFYCYYSENLKGYYSGTSYYTCPNGCQDGACVKAVEPSITVLSPNGGEEWVIGNSYEIKWNATKNIQTVSIELVNRLASSAFNEVIAENTPNDGSFLWIIPESIATFQSFGGPESGYDVRIEATNGIDLDFSDNYFSIVERPAYGLTVTLAPDTPVAATLIAGQSLAPLAKFKFTNGDSREVKITKIRLNRIGVSRDSTLSDVYLFEGDTRLTDGASVTGGYATFTDSTGIIRIPANSSETITVKSDIASGTAGQTVGARISSASDINTDASGVRGSFPITGNLMSIASANLARVDFSSLTLPSTTSISLQNNYIVWQNTVNISTRKVNLTRLSLREIGTVNYSDLTNFRLYVDGVKVATTKDLDANGYVAFDLSKELNTGNRVIKVLADIIGGSSKIFSFSLRKAADVSFVDSVYEREILPSATGSTFSARTSGTITITADQVTCTDTDGGKDYYVKGITKQTTEGILTGQVADYCRDDNTTLTEFYCTGNYDIELEDYICPNGCQDGACLKDEEPSITVISPNGGEEWVIGNSYTITWNHSGVNEVGIYLLDFEGIGEEILINRFVSVSPSTYSWAITNNISAGDKYKIELRGYYGATSDEYISDESDNHFSIVAASGTCTDTDGGKVYDVKGTVEANDKTYTDYCAGAFWLKEYSCSSSGDVVEEGVICPNNGSCKDGACVEAPTEVICTDTDNGKDYYTKGTTRWGPISGKYNTATDGCSSDGKTLSEFHCYYSENLKGYYSGTSYYTCPNGCQDGACKLGVKLSSQNPNSHEVAAGATTSPISGSSEISHRFLVFEVDNPSNQTVNIKRLAVSLEGTASPYDFGEVLWQVDGRSIGYSYFGSNGYADIPDYTTQTPLLTIAPKTKKTVEVFAFVKSTASEGSTAKFVMSGTGMIYITADGFNFGGMPISGNTMTITKKTLSAGMKYQGTYSMNALAGNTISAVVTLTNKSSEEMKLTELAMGNPSDGNTFLNYIDKDSYTVGTSKLRDMGRSNSTGYRIFSILPSISLPAKSTISYAVSGRLNRTVPVSQISITFNEFAGYGTSSLSPVRTSGVLTGKINISGGATGYKDISNSLADISSTLSRLIEAFKQDILGR